MSTAPLTATDLSVIAVTLNRPDSLRRCLECLRAQEPLPGQIIMVDGSADERSRAVASDFAGVEYLRNPRGYGHMTLSRNMGLRAAQGSVVAFLDDDAFARPGWSREILQPYSVSPELGGLRDEYPGTEVREETDLCLRVRALGGRLVYNPAAAVEHAGGGQTSGLWADLQREFYAKRNHTYLLLRNYGPGHAIFWRNFDGSIWQTIVETVYKLIDALGRGIAGASGLAAGLLAGLSSWVWHGTQPTRQDWRGKDFAAHLADSPAPARDLPAKPVAAETRH
jgi:GT2 family glycosyltransferase